MTVQTITSPQVSSITMMGVSRASYELLKSDLRDQPIELTYDSEWLQIERRGGEVGVLESIRWETYESLCRDFSDHGPRMTYDDGRLWIMSPTHRHDRLRALIGRMIGVLCLELRIPLSSFGSATWHPLIGKKGMEADETYYVTTERLVRGKDHIDLTVDPPPDLAVEVEETHPLLKRLPILVALGVPELWHFKNNELRAYKLAEGKYEPIETSLCFPMLRPSDLNRFLDMRHSTEETTLMVSFQEWVRTLAK